MLLGRALRALRAGLKIPGRNYRNGNRTRGGKGWLLDGLLLKFHRGPMPDRGQAIFTNAGDDAQWQMTLLYNPTCGGGRERKEKETEK